MDTLNICMKEFEYNDIYENLHYFSYISFDVIELSGVNYFLYLILTNVPNYKLKDHLHRLY